MGCLAPHSEKPGVYTFDFRFRHYRDDLVFLSDDEKYWYHVESTSLTPGVAIAKVRNVVHHIASMAPTDGPVPLVDELLYQGNFGQFMDAFAAKPWAHNAS